MKERSITEKQMIEKAFAFDELEEQNRNEQLESVADLYHAKAKAIRMALTECFPDYTW